MKLGYILTVFFVCLSYFVPQQDSIAQEQKQPIIKQDLKPIQNATESIQTTVEQLHAEKKETNLKTLELLKRVIKRKRNRETIVKKVFIPVPVLINADSATNGNEYFIKPAPCDTLIIHDTIIIRKKRRPLINIKF